MTRAAAVCIALCGGLGAEVQPLDFTLNATPAVSVSLNGTCQPIRTTGGRPNSGSRGAR